MAKIGDALKKAVEVELPEDETSKRLKRSSSVLMNSNRLRIFQELCFRPCLSLADLASALSVSRATASWHLEKLIEAGYVEKHRTSNKDRFWAKGMIRQGELTAVFSLLNDNKCGALFGAIVENPGADTSTLKKILHINTSFTACVRKLEDANLVTVVKDGKYLRSYPTTKVKELAKTESARLRAFHSSLIKRLEREHLRPEIIERKGEFLIIKINIFENSERIEIPQKLFSIMLNAKNE